MYKYTLIRDSPGEDRFPTYYKLISGCMLMYDITNSKSFERLGAWKEDFLTVLSPNDAEHFSFIALGNKSDLEKERKVPTEKDIKWCSENGGMPFFEVSSYCSTEISNAVDKLASDILNYI